MLTLLAACREPSRAGVSSSAVDASVIDDAGQMVDGGSSLSSAVASGVGRLPVSLVVDGGVEFGGDRIELDAVDELQLHIGAPLLDYRVRVIDRRDQVVVSDDRAIGVDGGIDYQVRLREPLSPGRTYRLVIDAQSGAAIDDSAGRQYPDFELVLAVRGISAPEPAPARRPTKDRRKPPRSLKAR